MFWKKKRPVVNEVKPGAGIGPEEAQLLINSLNDVRSRIAQAVSGGYDFADTLHNIYLDFGYPQTLTFDNFWNMYRRFGIASAVVELPVDTTWMRPPTVDSDNQQFLNDLEKLTKQLKLWQRLNALDTRQRVGRYAGMFMRVRDNKRLDKPIDTKLNGIAGIVQMVPLYEGQLEVLETESDETKENYDMPTMYQFKGSGAGNRNDKNASTFPIHPDRIVISSEDADNGGIYGIPALESCYNSLMDLRKILGGGGEGFYKNAAQSILFNLQDGASAKGNEKILEKFNDNYDEFSRNRFRRGLWTPGMEAKPLQSDLKDPKEFFFNSLYDVSASANIPATVIIGQQTGRLASNEDSRSFLSGINARREGFGTENVENIIDWFIFHEILPAAEYEVEWDDLLALSQKEQLDNSDKMADINKKQFDSAGTRPFTAEEVREAAGYEPMEDIEPEGEVDIDDMEE